MEKENICDPSSEKCSAIYENILEFQYSFGYNTQKYFNMCVADKCTIIFGSGNLIHIYNIEKGERRFHRTWTGGGIGHITKNPLFEHIAVADNGYEPVVVIYNWPCMDVISVLRGGTTKSYSFMSYSPDGEMLCVQGGDPDFLLTIWDWRNAVILRQQRSHVNDVYNIVFSPYSPQMMCTGGKIYNCHHSLL
ncbi:cilia- and flagella-associated protein 44 [Schistocerca nitens]|uniref:cilia- and flagella-associated protein 44 n=1 Tax=Schistocerca nitens TaxID=7011 RepID=UPI0021179AB9|nr:cilia- and flagella-associated protein 44 [Schistocerca nitens]